ncbi:MAG: PilZ domain-containing protein [Bdellovibrionales bacterium]|nr:PilZ domain-containing protein [Bdellovibrionales bacterium]
MDKRAVFCICGDPNFLQRFHASILTIERDHPIQKLTKLDELDAIVRDGPVVLLATVRSQAELYEVVAGLKRQVKALQSRLLIPIAIQSGLSDKLEKILITAGCKEVLPERSDFKAVNAKIGRYLKIVENNYALLQKTESSKTFTGGSKSPVNESVSVELVHFTEPVQLLHDFWIISNKRPAQRNMGRWIVTAIGPSPAVGSWVSDPKNKHAFIFDVHTIIKSDFYSPDGRWVFHGAKPEFSFELGKWSFVGNEPKLEWVGKDGKVTAVRFFFKSGMKKLTLTENSSITLGWMKRIEATFDRDYRFQDDKAQEFGSTSAGGTEFDVTAESEFENLVKDIPSDVKRFLSEAKEQYVPKLHTFNTVDEKNFNRFLQVAGQYEDQGILWMAGRVFLTNVKVYDVDLVARLARVVMMPLRVDPLKLIDDGLEASGDKKIYVNLKLLETSLFFYAERDVITCDENGIVTLKIPESAHEVQRRGGMRLSMTPKLKKDIQLKKIPPTAKGDWKIIDISPEGIGIETSVDSFAFVKEQNFKIQMMLAGTTLNLVCQTRWFKSEGAAKVRVGARFVHLTKKSSEFLELYIMEKYLERIRYALGK